jgi:hypothetical protein
LKKVLSPFAGVTEWRALGQSGLFQDHRRCRWLYTEHIAEHGDTDLKSNSGEKSDQHCARKEILPHVA